MPNEPDPILVLPEDGRPIYAIGDVHGMRAELERMMALVEGDAARHLAQTGVKPIAILLGDYVDRGPASLEALQLIRSRVVDDARPVRWIALMGNHEELMLDGLAGDESAFLQWLANGGFETLRSGGVDLDDLAPAAIAKVFRRHGPLLDWVATLPTMVVIGSLECPTRLFVHAGIDPRRPLGDQDRAVLLWTRAFRSDADYPCLVVHGHTIVPEIHASARRLNLDTGCFTQGGRLSAARIEPGRPTILLQVARDSLQTAIRRTTPEPASAA